MQDQSMPAATNSNAALLDQQDLFDEKVSAATAILDLARAADPAGIRDTSMRIALSHAMGLLDQIGCARKAFPLPTNIGV